MTNRSLSTFIILFAGLSTSAFAEETRYVTKENIHYYSDAANRSDAYIDERCVLDIYHPTNKKGFATVVWFHGGGLKGGNKKIADQLKRQGIAVVAVNYRLYPRAKAPSYLEDSAAAVAWTFKNIKSLGGDPKKIFVSGSSAGGYLTAMIGLDKRWLKVHDINADLIAGLIPLAGQMLTHFTVKEERGIGKTKMVIDHLAPISYLRSTAPPVLLVTGDREKEMLGRYEENAFMYRMLKVVGHPDVRLIELSGFGHAPRKPFYPLLLKEVARVLKPMKD
ncbi:MAG: alpha/beta hydrolase [Rubritalea sp.]|jgi:acetyl esterase/lipase|tara:strand:- start:5767 stop:6600 length:834 start_codon:yes stop_codon:yes gene_type:complete